MAIINRLPRGGGGLKLLYENTSQTIQTSAFTLNIDLSAYTHVLISAGDVDALPIAKTHNVNSFTLVEVGTTGHLIWFGGTFTDGNFGQIGVRDVTVSSTGLSFTAKSGSNSTKPLVYKVYGVKL